MTNEEILRIREAIKVGDVAFIESCCINWRELIVTEEHGNKILALHYAAKHGQLEVVQHVVESYPTLLNLTDSFNQTVIRFAAANNHLPIVRYLAERGADCRKATNVPGSDKHGFGPIHWAAVRGHHEVVQYLLGPGVARDRLSVEIKSLLFIASQFGHVEVVSLLLTHEPGLLNCTNTRNETLVCFAAANNRLPLVEYLVACGIDLTIETNNTESDAHGYGPIHWATANGHCAVVQYLLGRGVARDRPSVDIQPLMFIASQFGHVEVVNLLLEQDSGLIECRDARNNPPLYYAVANNHLLVIICLVARGADINIVSDHQRHLIHIASHFGHVDVVRFLLEQDASLLERRDAYNQTPLIMASINGQPQVVEYLIGRQADLEVATSRAGHVSDGKTALNLAIDNGHSDVENLLLLAKTPSENQESILPFVRTGAQALSLVALDPTLTSLFLQDERISGLMTTSADCHTASESIRWYRKATSRRPSFFGEIDIETRTASVFHPEKELGRGSYGFVRLFKTETVAKTQRFVAVKQPIIIRPEEEWQCQEELNREAQFNIEAYPEGLSETFEFEGSTREGGQRYTNRYVMPHIAGETLFAFMPQITCPNQLADITLKIVQEVERVHALGIVHSDLSHSNIMVYRHDETGFGIRLIDFGLASYMTESTARCWGHSYAGLCCIPPELCKGETIKVKPHANQDVFGLGFTLNLVFENHPIRDELVALFPCITSFIVDAHNEDPTRRPTLSDFLEQLNHALHPTDTTDTELEESYTVAVAVAAAT